MKHLELQDHHAIKYNEISLGVDSFFLPRHLLLALTEPQVKGVEKYSYGDEGTSHCAACICLNSMSKAAAVEEPSVWNLRTEGNP